MLHQVVVNGTGRRAQLGFTPQAGKTGTTQNHRDAWYIGYTAHLVTGVWFGNDDSSGMRRVTGGTLPAMTWQRFMTEALSTKEAAPLAGCRSTTATPGLWPSGREGLRRCACPVRSGSGAARLAAEEEVVITRSSRNPTALLSCSRTSSGPGLRRRRGRPQSARPASSSAATDRSQCPQASNLDSKAVEGTLQLVSESVETRRVS
jgi:membrane peptidoglycan carboxypeptidase